MPCNRASIQQQFPFKQCKDFEMESRKKSHIHGSHKTSRYRPYSNVLIWVTSYKLPWKPVWQKLYKSGLVFQVCVQSSADMHRIPCEYKFPVRGPFSLSHRAESISVSSRSSLIDLCFPESDIKSVGACLDSHVTLCWELNTGQVFNCSKDLCVTGVWKQLVGEHTPSHATLLPQGFKFSSPWW